jgi:hypothetical protein
MSIFCDICQCSDSYDNAVIEEIDEYGEIERSICLMCYIIEMRQNAYEDNNTDY